MRITWFGHSCFRLDMDATVLLIDPFLKGNPVFEKSGISFDLATKGVTHVALTHGHDDHVGNAGEICVTRKATLFAVPELAQHVAKSVADRGAIATEQMNTGGTVETATFALTLTQALHSSSSGGVYLGNPCGIVVKPKGGPTVYHMGDTDIFTDMGLIQELHCPHVGIVPIGDRYTMGSRTAAFACKRFFKFKTVIPCHFGTFPALEPTADRFVHAMAPQSVTVPKVGDAITVANP